MRAPAAPNTSRFNPEVSMFRAARLLVLSFSFLLSSPLQAQIDHYLLTAPPTVDPMVAFTLTATAQDVNDATVDDSTTTFFIEAGSVEFSDGAGGWTSVLGQRTLTNGTFSIEARMTSGGFTASFVLTDQNGASGFLDVAVNAVRPTGFVIDAVSSPQTAGAPFAINVTALDANNATMTDFNDTVTLFTTGSGTLTPATSAAFTNGVLTGQMVTLTTAGDHQVVVSDVSAQVLSNTFTVTPAALNGFAFDPIGSVSSGTPFDVTMRAVDAYGNAVPSFNGTVGLTVNAGSVAPLTSGAFSNGVRTESVTLTTTAGARILTATRSGGTESGSSAAFSASGPLDHFSIATIPSQVAGIGFNVVITAQDAGNNTVTAFNGTVDLATDGGGTTPSTSAAFVNGVRTEMIHVFNAGSRTLIVTRTTGAESGSSNAFTVAPAELSGFEFSLVPRQTAGVPFDVTITAQDGYRNTVTSFTGTVAISDDSGTISPTTSNAFAGGVLTQSVTIPRSGTRTLTVSDATASGSTVFPVDAGPLDHFDVAAIGSQTSASPFTVSVTARDDQGNVAPFNGTVSFALDSGTVSPAFSDSFFNGALSQSITIASSGTKILTVTNGAGSQTGMSNAFEVAASDVDHFVVSAVGSQTAGAPFSVTLTAQDAANNTVTAFNGTVDATVDAGTVTPAVSPAFSSGTVTFDVAVTEAGTRTVAFLRTGGVGSGSTGAFNVVPGATRQFTFDPIGTQGAGAAFPVTITARDGSGNLTPTFNGTAALTTPSGSAVTPSTSAAFVNGVLTQSVTINTASGHQLIASAGSVTGTSDLFTVSPGPLHHFTINDTGTQTAGTAFLFGMSARDEFDNLVDYNGTVDFSVDRGTISPAVSASFSQGQTIPNVTLTASGTCTITATRTGGSESGSNSIVVEPASLHHFAFSPIPTPQVAGTPFAVTLTAIDIYENTASYTGAAILSVDGGSVTPESTDVFANGQVTLSVVLTAAGTRTLTASSFGAATSSSARFEVVAGAPDAARSAIAASPTSVPADGNATSTISVTMRDAHGNPIAGLPVTLTGSTASTISSLNPVTNAGGVATFSVSSTSAASVVYSASAGGVPVTQTATVTFGAGSVQRLEVTMPSGAQAGVEFMVTLRALDSQGNLATSFNGHRSVTFGAAPAPSRTPTVRTSFGPQPFGSLLLPFFNGTTDVLVTFYNVGTHSVSIAAQDVATSFTAGIVVTPGPAAAFTFENLPSSQYVGLPLTSGSLRVSDAHGNVVTNFNAAQTPVSFWPCNDVSGINSVSVGAGRGCVLDSATDFTDGIASLQNLSWKGQAGRLQLMAFHDRVSGSGLIELMAGTIRSVTPDTACSDWATDLDVVVTGQGLLPGTRMHWNHQVVTFPEVSGARSMTKTVPWAFVPAAGATATISFHDPFGNRLTFEQSAPAFRTLPPLTASASNDGATCEGATATLTGVAGANATSTVWKTPAGATLDSTAVTSISNFTAAQAGEYEFVVRRGFCKDAVATTILEAAAPLDATITAPERAVAGTATTASVAATTGATYNWTVTGGTITGPNDGPSISWIPADVDSAQLTVEMASGGANGCRTTKIHQTNIERCTQAAPTLLAPAGSVELASPVTFSWTALANVTEYEVVISKQNTTIRKQLTGTQIRMALPAGDYTWTVSARVGNCQTQIQSATGAFTVLDGAACQDSPVAVPLHPLNGTVIDGTNVRFRWSAVPGASRYFVFATINGQPVADLGGVEAPATELTASVGAEGPVVWYVVAYFNGCEGKPSLPSFFSRPTCSNAAPTLISADGFDPAKREQTVTFRWNGSAPRYILRIRNRSGFDVPIRYGQFEFRDGLPILRENATSVQVRFEMFGTLSWSVEAVTAACGNVESLRLPLNLTLPWCTGSVGDVTILQPLATTPLDDSSPVQFRWTNPANAGSSQLLLSRDGGPFAVVGNSGTAATLALPMGDYRWMVRAATSSGCTRDSVITEFRVDDCGGALGATSYGQPEAAKGKPGAGAIPSPRRTILLSPQPMDTVAGDAVRFEWIRRPDALSYRLQVGRACAVPGQCSPGGDAPFLDIPVAVPPEPAQCRRKGSCPPTVHPGHTLKLAPGRYYWILTVEYTDRCETQAVKMWFNMIPEPCGTVPTITMPSTTSESDSYTVTWNNASLEGVYELQEFTHLGGENYTVPVNPVTYTVTGNSRTFRTAVGNDGGSGSTQRMYRVRPLDCLKTYSPIARIQIRRANDIGSALEYAATDLYREMILEFDQTDMGRTFTAIGDAFNSIFSEGPRASGTESLTYRITSDVPWLTIEPSSGEYVPTQLAYTVDTANLPIGTSTAFVKLEISDGRPPVTIPITISGRAHVEHANAGEIDPRAIIVPTVAHVEGNDTFYRSDVRISNLGSETRSYELAYSAADATQSSKVTIAIGAGQTLALDDVLVNGSFVDREADASGYLQIRPLLGPDEEDVTAVASRTFARTPGGTFGDFVESVRLNEFAGAGDVVTMMPVEQSARRRTNLVFVAASGSDAKLRVVARNSSGGVAGEFPLVVPAGTRLQLNVPLAARGISLETGRIDVHVVEGFVSAHASMLEQGTNDATIVPGVRGATIRESEYILAGFGHIIGANGTWRSDLYMTNAGDSTQTATLRFFTAAGEVAGTTNMTLAAGETKQVSDALPTLFGTANTVGSLRATTAEDSSLVMASVTYFETNHGVLGQAIRSHHAADARGVEDDSLQIPGAAQSPSYRTNVGIAEVSGKPVTVEIQVISADGLQSFDTIELPANGFMQLNSVASSLGLSGDNIRVALKVIDGEGRIVAYASVLDNASGDPSYIPAR